MKNSTSIIYTLFAAAIILGVSSQASAERVFPPAHLAPQASFPAGTVSDQEVKDAWYQTQSTEQRESLVANEVQEASPYPARYYFINIRDHANDESDNLAAYRNVQPSISVQVADETDSEDDNS